VVVEGSELGSRRAHQFVQQDVHIHASLLDYLSCNFSHGNNLLLDKSSARGALARRPGTFQMKQRLLPRGWFFQTALIAGDLIFRSGQVPFYYILADLINDQLVWLARLRHIKLDRLVDVLILLLCALVVGV